MFLRLVVLVGCFAGLRLLFRVYRHLTSPLRSVPGPFLARFTNLWYFWKLTPGSFEVTNQELHEKYGPIVRYGPNRYSFDDPTAVKAIYGHGTQFIKSTWYESWMPRGVWSLFSERNIHDHSQYRRQYQKEYSMSSLVEYEPLVNECADLFGQRLEEFSRSGELFNMGHWMQCYALDVVGSITYSRRLGYLDRGEDIGGIKSALESNLFVGTLVGVYPFLHPYPSMVDASRHGSDKGITYAINLTLEALAERQKVTDEEEQAPVKVKDFLHKFIAKNNHDSDTFTTYHIMQGCAMNIVAGSDTTGISLSACLYFLLKHPQCYAKLREEIMGSGRTGAESRDISFKQSQEMPYLQAVLKEALRLHPATGLPLERIVSAGGATIAGRFFPAGSIVGVNTWIEHRNTHIFGTDANEFRPERWLSDDAEKVATMNSHWMPFGYGSRTCIGRHISFLEISKLIPRLVRDFDFELSGDLAARGSTWATDNYWFVKPTNFMVRVTPRKEL
ncbi:cytochrome P450 [Jackrogersella minutella]|nr:cytochrome P450 [Jackrogersella minutella]